ncbi:MAG: hypothetical protein IPF95_09825 [Flavobacteriales bacterium]|nr:hypothetical protein [Flavobacteriales bacterium]HQV53159.1 hypothetical protein [Flavobacteriales bacterium]
MNSPARFAFTFIGFVCMIALILAIIVSMSPHATRVDYYDGMNAKHERLHALESPKAIIIGGSSATFGIDSEMLEKALCRPVVNMSIHAALGFGFMVREIEGEIRKGDLILVCLEQDVISDPEKFNHVTQIVTERYLNGLNYVPKKHWPEAILGAATMRLQAGWKLLLDPSRKDLIDPIYRAAAFNEFGDMVGYDLPMELDTIPLDTQVFSNTLIGEKFRALWRTLESEAECVGATVVFIWPAIARSSYDALRDEVLFKELQQMDIPLVGKPEQCVYPDSAFLDTPYHLKLWGRNTRTEKLVSDLCGIPQLTCCAKDPDPSTTE